MKEALLFELLDGDKVRCRVCAHYCVIAPGKLGRCLTRKNVDGKAYSLIYGKVSSVACDPIEKKPLFHFYPGSLALSLGTLGCNLKCGHCQNWTISHARVEENIAGLEDISPEECIRIALKNNCRGIAWTYNEPSIWLEYTLEGAELAKKNNLYTVYVTNGFISPESLDTIGPFLDAFRVDIKGFTKDFYHRVCGIDDFQPILKAAVRAKEKWGCHIEVVTNVIPGYNDDRGQLADIARWIKGNLGEDTPWHVTRFFPAYDFGDLAPTPVETLKKARKIGEEAELRYIYTGNVPNDPGENTYCYHCGAVLIERFGYSIKKKDIVDGRCGKCGTEVGGVNL